MFKNVYEYSFGLPEHFHVKKKNDNELGRTDLNHHHQLNNPGVSLTIAVV